MTEEETDRVLAPWNASPAHVSSTTPAQHEVCALWKMWAAAVGNRDWPKPPARSGINIEEIIVHDAASPSSPPSYFSRHNLHRRRDQLLLPDRDGACRGGPSPSQQLQLGPAVVPRALRGDDGRDQAPRLPGELQHIFRSSFFFLRGKRRQKTQKKKKKKKGPRPRPRGLEGPSVGIVARQRRRVPSQARTAQRREDRGPQERRKGREVLRVVRARLCLPR